MQIVLKYDSQIGEDGGDNMSRTAWIVVFGILVLLLATALGKAMNPPETPTPSSPASSATD